ncbi:hypothetical protein ACFYM0_32840 [Streptomyces sp. NPDC006487]|uniref:hypothetical protein n=1 Tax=Streptomyces sp. NPDC006487 TaxID=3364748 RepID=UPI0036C712C6
MGEHEQAENDGAELERPPLIDVQARVVTVGLAGGDGRRPAYGRGARSPGQ